RRRAEYVAHLQRGLGAAVAHVGDGVGAVPAGEGMQDAGEWMPVGRAQALVALAVRGVALAAADQQPLLEQPLERRGGVWSEFARIDPFTRAHRTEQLTLGGIDFDLGAQVRRQGQPAAFATQAVA